MFHRLYEKGLKDHFLYEKNMAFLAGPRQSGKTTTAREFEPKRSIYLNWDNQDDRLLLRSKPARLKEELTLNPTRKTLILDEIHKNPQWKGWLKGFYDKYHDSFKIIVTGSARLDLYKKGGDSLLGRYFLYRHHPLSLGELHQGAFINKIFRTPLTIPASSIEALMSFGGFPKPFFTARKESHTKWVRMRKELISRQDIRELSKIEDLAGVEMLMKILPAHVGGLLSYQNLATDLNVSVDTVRRWIKLLETLYYVYLIRPYSKNIKRSLHKTPKLFFWDWSEIVNDGARYENMIASHLLKSVHYWTDSGLGDFGLYYLRDKEKREVDFLVTRDEKPFILVEAKKSEKNISRNLYYFQELLKPEISVLVSGSLKSVGMPLQEASSPLPISATDFCSQIV
jgi:predicted AAA+ superfamily ATPase